MTRGNSVIIRPAVRSDYDAIWQVVEPIVEELVAIFTKDEGKRESKRERVPAAE